MHLPMNAPVSSASEPAPGQPRSATSREAGFSIIEGLIAALLLLIVTLGILPLFSRAMNNNVKGNDSTRQASGATDAFETSVALLFNSGAMTVPGGATSVVVTDTIALKEIASPTGGASQAISSRWEPLGSLGSDDLPVMNRQLTLQQYSYDDYADNQEFDTPLNGDTQPRLVHFKVIEVDLLDATGGGARPYQLRMVQAY
jgi:type II secretory pathway pseudopilin PulG